VRVRDLPAGGATVQLTVPLLNSLPTTPPEHGTVAP
jgi:hypothetical protein